MKRIGRIGEALAVVGVGLGEGRSVPDRKRSMADGRGPLRSHRYEDGEKLYDVY